LNPPHRKGEVLIPQLGFVPNGGSALIGFSVSPIAFTEPLETKGLQQPMFFRLKPKRDPKTLTLIQLHKTRIIPKE
jgi:hypothetical protein